MFWERQVAHQDSSRVARPDPLQSYIPLAFKTARAADPQAKLYINDYNLHNSTKLDPLVALVTKLNKENPGLIDGIGTEMHLTVRRYLMTIPVYLTALFIRWIKMEIKPVWPSLLWRLLLLLEPKYPSPNSTSKVELLLTM